MIVYAIDGSTTAVNYWKQERLVVKKQMHDLRDKVLMWTNLQGSQSSPIAQYYGYAVGNTGEVCVDLTDYVRTYPNVSTIYIQEEGATLCTLNMTMKGLINPANVIIPYHPLKAYGALIVPPSKLLIAANQQGLEESEFYKTSGTWSVSGGASLGTSGRVIGQIESAFTLSDGTHSRKFQPKTRHCGVEYAFVKWISFTGIERTHIFEVSKVKTETADAFSLMPIDNEYIEIKGRKDGLSLRLDGLCAYDLWYYSDVITSSNVQVSLDGTNWDRVQVTTKSITQPDGEGGDGELEIAINCKRYDAVAM